MRTAARKDHRCGVTVLELILVSFFALVSCASVFAANPSQSGLESPKYDSSNVAKPVKLYGRIDKLDNAYKSAGITLESEALPSKIKAVRPGSVAARSNIGSGDMMLQAKLYKQELALTVGRNGKEYKVLLDLRDGQAGNRNLALAAQSQPPNDGRNFRVEVCIYYRDEPYFTDPKYSEITSNEGFTPEALDQIFTWEKEVHYQGHDGPLSREWGMRYQAVNDFLNQYFKAHWPANLIGYRQYHVAYDRSGAVIKIWPNLYPPDFATNEAEFDAQAYAAINALSKARLYSFPQQSRVKTYHDNLIFENYHSLQEKY